MTDAEAMTNTNSSILASVSTSQTIILRDIRVGVQTEIICAVVNTSTVLLVCSGITLNRNA